MASRTSRKNPRRQSVAGGESVNRKYFCKAEPNPSTHKTAAAAGLRVQLETWASRSPTRACLGFEKHVSATEGAELTYHLLLNAYGSPAGTPVMSIVVLCWIESIERSSIIFSNLGASQSGGSTSCVWYCRYLVRLSEGHRYDGVQRVASVQMV